VATARQPTIFEVWMRVGYMLQRCEFSNLDGSSFGEVATQNLKIYVDLFKLADVRASREKTIEGVVLAERLKSFSLYNECFVHAVGKYEDIRHIQSPKYELISGTTRTRLERAS